MNWVDGLFAIGATILKDMCDNKSSGYTSSDDDSYDDEYEYETNRYERFAEGISSSIEQKQADLEKHTREDYQKHARQLSKAELRNAMSRAKESGNSILIDVLQAEMNKRGM